MRVKVHGCEVLSMLFCAKLMWLITELPVGESSLRVWLRVRPTRGWAAIDQRRVLTVARGRRVESA